MVTPKKSPVQPGRSRRLVSRLSEVEVRGSLLGLGIAALLLTACATAPEKKPSRLLIPPEMRLKEAAAKNDAAAPIVVRLSQPNQVAVEVEVPVQRAAGEVRVPLNQGTAQQKQTGADVVAANAVMPATNSAANKSAYLSALSRINQLYVDQKFDTALVEVEALEKEYAKDARLFAMKGSLFIKLGDKPSAVKAWKRALQLNPDDEALADALDALEEEP